MGAVSDTPPRPSHTTLAAGLVIGGSVGVVIGVAQQLSGLHSLETREAVSDFLAEPPGNGLGLDVTGALRVLRVALMVVAGCATAAAVLGYHALQRSHRARVGLTLLAAPIFLGGLATGGFLTSLVAAASVLLWIGPSGAWFRGEPTERPVRRDQPDRPTRPTWPPAYPPREDPPEAAEAPESRATPAATQQPGPATVPFGQPPPPAAGPSEPVRRPDALVWACVLTWAFSSLVLVVMGASVLLVSTNPDLVLDELARQGRDIAPADLGLLRTTTYVFAAVAAVWSLAAIVLAVPAYRGVGWARVALVASAAAAGLLSLLASLTSLLLLVPAVVCLATVLLLNQPRVRAWFRRT